MRGKLPTIIIVAATLILAGVAVFTAVRLYQTRQESVTPSQPVSTPAAQIVPATECETCGGAQSVPCDDFLTCNQGLCVPENFQGNPQSYCEGDPSVQACPVLSFSISSSTPTPTGTSTPRATPTVTATPAATSSPAPAAATSQPGLPEAGTSWPTFVGLGLGVLIIITSVILAL